MIEIVDARINTLPFQATPQAESTILHQLLAELRVLKGEFSHLREENQALRDKIASQNKCIASLEIQQDKDFEEIASKINEHSEAINKCWQYIKITPTIPRGEKTKARIEMLKDILKAKGGSVTFGEAERLLKIKPNQMTKLMSQLDKRSFETFTRVGDDRQKVIRLKGKMGIDLSRER